MLGDCILNSIMLHVKVHIVRIAALPDGSGIHVLYKSDVSTPGWFPRPAPTIPCELWRVIRILEKVGDAFTDKYL